MDMPLIGSIAGLNEAQSAIAARCLGPNGRLRSTKPKGARSDMGDACYVWRMVAFQVSPRSQHQCMPMTAEFDLPEQWWTLDVPRPGQPGYDQAAYSDALRRAGERRREHVRELSVIVDAMVNAVPKSEWHGIARWARVLR